MQSRTLNICFSIVEEFRKLDPQMPLQTAATFLIVASSPGIAMKELNQRLLTTQASCSRNVAALSRFRKFETPGHGLVYTEENPKSRRSKNVNLTPEGEQLAMNLAAIWGEDYTALNLGNPSI